MYTSESGCVEVIFTLGCGCVEGVSMLHGVHHKSVDKQVLMELHVVSLGSSCHRPH